MNQHVLEDSFISFSVTVFGVRLTTCPPVDVVYVADIPVGVRGGLCLFTAATCHVIDGFFIAVAYDYDYDHEYMILI